MLSSLKNCPQYGKFIQIRVHWTSVGGPPINAQLTCANLTLFLSLSRCLSLTSGLDQPIGFRAPFSASAKSRGLPVPSIALCGYRSRRLKFVLLPPTSLSVSLLLDRGPRVIVYPGATNSLSLCESHRRLIRLIFLQYIPHSYPCYCAVVWNLVLTSSASVFVCSLIHQVAQY